MGRGETDRRGRPGWRWAVSLLGGIVGLVWADPFSEREGLDRKSATRNLQPATRNLQLPIPAAYEQKIAAALADAGENGQQIAQALRTVPEEQREALGYLITTLTRFDLANVTADFLLENVALAYQARQTLPWGREVPDDLFRRYVLPCRINAERLDPWRREFYTHLGPAVQRCSSSGEAALLLNRWQAAHVPYQPNLTYDQSPFETLKAGYGRCGELIILLISLCRSCSIPARSAYTPWWATGDDNHAWVEVWDSRDRQWHFLEASGKTPLDQAWFTETARQTGKVLASAGYERHLFHLGTSSIEGLEDVTARYAPTGTLSVQIVESERPIPDSLVHVCVWNTGCWRSIAWGRTDQVGRVTFEVGARAGAYLVTAGPPDGGPTNGAWQFVQPRAGETTPIRLDLARWKEAEVFQFPPPEPKESEVQSSLPPIDGGGNGGSSGSEASCSPSPLPNFGPRFDPGRDAAVLQLVDEAQREGLAAALTDAGGNWREIATALRETSGGARDLVVKLVEGLNHYDRCQITAAALIDHAVSVERMQERRPFSVPEDLFDEYVRPIRIAGEFIYQPWRSRLHDLVQPRIGRVRKPTEAARRINRWLARTVEERELNNRVLVGKKFHLDPLSTLRAHRGSQADLAVLAVAALRSVGIPARFTFIRYLGAQDGGAAWAEFYDGCEWLPLYPSNPRSLGDYRRLERGRPRNVTLVVAQPTARGEFLASTAVTRRYTSTGIIRLVVRENGQAAADFPHFSINVLNAGAWQPLTDDLDPKTDSQGIFQLEVGEGEYLVEVGKRGSFAVLRRLRVKPGQIVTCTVDVATGEWQ